MKVLRTISRSFWIFFEDEEDIVVKDDSLPLRILVTPTNDMTSNQSSHLRIPDHKVRNL